MTLSQALFNYLSTYAGLASLVSTRVYPVALPQGATLPAVTYQARFQFTVWASSYADREAIALQLIAALEGYSGTMGGGSGVVVLAIQGEGETDDYEPSAKVWQAALDFTITHLGD